MKNMFCFQCEQTAGNIACTARAGVCGKQDHTANLQDKLIGALISLAKKSSATPGNEASKLILEGLFTTVTNVSFDDRAIDETISRIEALSGADSFDMKTVWEANEDIRSLKALILYGIKGIAAYAYHAYMLGYTDDDVNSFFVTALEAIGNDAYGMEELLPRSR